MNSHIFYEYIWKMVYCTLKALDKWLALQLPIQLMTSQPYL